MFKKLYFKITVFWHMTPFWLLLATSLLLKKSEHTEDGSGKLIHNIGNKLWIQYNVLSLKTILFINNAGKTWNPTTYGWHLKQKPVLRFGLQFSMILTTITLCQQIVLEAIHIQIYWNMLQFLFCYIQAWWS